MRWNPTKETYVLRYLCYNDFLNQGFDDFVTELVDDINAKFGETFTRKDLSTKLNEYYDIDALSTLKASKTRGVDNESCKVEQDDSDKEKSKTDTDKKQIKHVTIDEDQNRVFSSLNTSSSVSEQDAKIPDIESVEPSENLIKQTSTESNSNKPDLITELDRAESVTAATKPDVSDEVNESQLHVETESKTLLNASKDKVSDKMETRNGEITKRVMKSKINPNDKELSEEKQLELSDEENRDAGKEKELEVDREFEDEEPAHLTRAQAKKLHINVEKEMVETEKKDQDLEEGKHSSDTKLQDNENTSIVVESEADESELTIKRTRTKRKADNESTQRRSSRLRRKSEGDISDKTKSKTPPPVGNEIEETEPSKVTADTPKKRGRRSKSVNLQDDSTEPGTPKNKPKNVTDFAESENDDVLIENTNKKEDKSENSTLFSGNDLDNPVESDEEANEEDTYGESILDVESTGESDGDRDSRTRRSSRKRKLDVNDDANLKKIKTDTSILSPPKRRGRKPKVESRENSIDGDESKILSSRRSTRRRP